MPAYFITTSLKIETCPTTNLANMKFHLNYMLVANNIWTETHQPMKKSHFTQKEVCIWNVLARKALEPGRVTTFKQQLDRRV